MHKRKLVRLDRGPQFRHQGERAHCGGVAGRIEHPQPLAFGSGFAEGQIGLPHQGGGGPRGAQPSRESHLDLAGRHPVGALKGAAHGLGLALSLVAAGSLEGHRKNIVRDMADPP